MKRLCSHSDCCIRKEQCSTCSHWYTVLVRTHRRMQRLESGRPSSVLLLVRWLAVIFAVSLLSRLLHCSNDRIIVIGNYDHKEIRLRVRWSFSDMTEATYQVSVPVQPREPFYISYGLSMSVFTPSCQKFKSLCTLCDIWPPCSLNPFVPHLTCAKTPEREGSVVKIKAFR